MKEAKASVYVTFSPRLPLASPGPHAPETMLLGSGKYHVRETLCSFQHSKPLGDMCPNNPHKDLISPWVFTELSCPLSSSGKPHPKGVPSSGVLMLAPLLATSRNPGGGDPPCVSYTTLVLHPALLCQGCSPAYAILV